MSDSWMERHFAVRLGMVAGIETTGEGDSPKCFGVVPVYVQAKREGDGSDLDDGRPSGVLLGGGGPCEFTVG